MINKGIKYSCGPQEGLCVEKKGAHLYPHPLQLFAKPSRLALFGIRGVSAHEY